MTDLLRVLPHFPVGQYASLIPALEKAGISTSDLLTLDAVDICKRTQLPILDTKRLCANVTAALHKDLQQNHKNATPQWQTISTLDPVLDEALGGGIPAGYVTEITGESGAGKTQFLLTLLLAVQLPPPHGLGRPALYISTEAALSTRRLAQMLTTNPLFKRLEDDDDDDDRNGNSRPSVRPSLDNIVSTVTPDLESQDHILTFQVPVEIERRNVGLLVLDSVAANYRAEFERSANSGSASNMGARGAELVRLGMQLRELAQKYNLAVVVANQVADRFSDSGAGLLAGGYKTPSAALTNNNNNTYTPSSPAALPRNTQESPLATRSRNIIISHQQNQSHPLQQTQNAETTATPTAPDVEPTSSISDLIPKSSMPPPTHPPPEDDLFNLLPQSNPNSNPLSTAELTFPNHPLALHLDHQQRWFTGWGDDPYHTGPGGHPLKTPSLGLVWSTQISARIALFKRPAYGVSRYDPDEEEPGAGAMLGMPTLKNWRRWMKVVFSPHAVATPPDGAVEFEVWMGGVRAVVKDKKKKGKEMGKGGDGEIARLGGERGADDD